MEIRVGAGCAYIENICFCQNMKVRGTELEIQVEASLLEKSIEVCYIYEHYRGGC